MHGESVNARELVDAQGFQRIEGDVILIAGSSDIADVRALAERAIVSALRETGDDRRLRPYSWDLELGPEGFDQRRSMQKKPNLMRLAPKRRRTRPAAVAKSCST